MRIAGADIGLDAWAEPADLTRTLERLVAGSPFRVERVDAGRGDHRRCAFGLVRPQLAVGYRNLIDLQYRISAEFDIVSVQRRMTAPAG